MLKLLNEARVISEIPQPKKKKRKETVKSTEELKYTLYGK